MRKQAQWPLKDSIAAENVMIPFVFWQSNLQETTVLWCPHKELLFGAVSHSFLILRGSVGLVYLLVLWSLPQSLSPCRVVLIHHSLFGIKPLTSLSNIMYLVIIRLLQIFKMTSLQNHLVSSTSFQDFWGSTGGLKRQQS